MLLLMKIGGSALAVGPHVAWVEPDGLRKRLDCHLPIPVLVGGESAVEGQRELRHGDFAIEIVQSEQDSPKQHPDPTAPPDSPHLDRASLPVVTAKKVVAHGQVQRRESGPEHDDDHPKHILSRKSVLLRLPDDYSRKRY